MNQAEIDSSIAGTQNKIDELRLTSPQAEEQKTLLGKAITLAKKALDDLKVTQDRFNNAETGVDSADLQDKIAALHDKLAEATTALFKEVQNKMVNEAEIADLEKTLDGLNLLYTHLYG